MVESKKALPKEPRVPTDGYGGLMLSDGRQEHLMGLALGFGPTGRTDVGFPFAGEFSVMRGQTSDTHRYFDNAYDGARIRQQHQHADVQDQPGYYKCRQHVSSLTNGNYVNNFNGSAPESNMDTFLSLENYSYN
jgi:hypothetical protein